MDIEVNPLTPVSDQPFADVVSKAAHPPRYFKTLSVVVVWDLNPQLPTQS